MKSMSILNLLNRDVIVGMLAWTDKAEVQMYLL